MQTIRSILKSFRLRRVSRVLGTFEGFPQIDIQNLGKPDKKDVALERLLDLCEADPGLKMIMDTQKASREDLREIYWLLMANGGGQWAAGHFVPASALAFGTTLLFLLEIRNQLSWGEISVLLIEYFERNDTGPVPLEFRGPANPNDPAYALWQLEQRVKQDE